MPSLFGSPLVTALARSSFTTPSGLSIPGILGRCFHEIEEKGLDIEGIFRKSGSTATVNQLQTQFEESHNPFLVKLPSTISTHSLAALFKRYLQQLPEPVIPRHYQPLFLNIFDEQKFTKETLKRRLKDVCKTLPHEHLHLLQFLLQVAHSIQQHQDKNHMSIESLAIIFAPTCIRMDAVAQLLPDSKQYNSRATPPSSSSHAFNTSKSCSSLLPVMLNKHQLFRKARELLLSAVVRKKQQHRNKLIYIKSSTEALLYKPNELLQLGLVRESNTWIQIFKFLMTYPEIFTTLTIHPPISSRNYLALPTHTTSGADATAATTNGNAIQEPDAIVSHLPTNINHSKMDSMSLWTSPFSQQEKKMLIDLGPLEFTDSHDWIKTFENFDLKMDHQSKEEESTSSITNYVKTLQIWKTREEENPTIVIPQKVIHHNKKKTTSSSRIGR